MIHVYELSVFDFDADYTFIMLSVQISLYIYLSIVFYKKVDGNKVAE